VYCVSQSVSSINVHRKGCFFLQMNLCMGTLLCNVNFPTYFISVLLIPAVPALHFWLSIRVLVFFFWTRSDDIHRPADGTGPMRHLVSASVRAKVPHHGRH
jgi:hypothetical protein